MYFWEEGEGGLEASWQGFDSFSDFLRNEIRVYRIENRPRVTDEILAAKKQPRGRQLWNPTRQEQAEGIEIDDLMFYLGIGTFDRLETAATLSGLNSEQYLEELSGWQSRTVIEEGEGGLEAYSQEFDSFSDFLRSEIGVYRFENKPSVTDEMLAGKQQPRGQQIWNPTREEQAEGIGIYRLMLNFGIGNFDRLEKAATLSGLNSEQYLEELSGWQSRTVIEEGEPEIRFFPPTA